MLNFRACEGYKKEWMPKLIKEIKQMKEGEQKQKAIERLKEHIKKLEE